MSDPSNPFKSLADSLLSGDAVSPDDSHAARSTDTHVSLAERIEAFFSSELLNTRLAELVAISGSPDPQSNEFLHAVAEEDPDPLLRIAATVQLIRLGADGEVQTLKSLFDDEAENARTYSLGLMLLDELPSQLIGEMTQHLVTTVPDEVSNQAALIQLVRDHEPSQLINLLQRCLTLVDNDLEALDEEVWNEFVYTQLLGVDLGAALSSTIQAYLQALDDDHPRKLDLEGSEDVA